MDGNGFTGLNPEMAATNIASFEGAVRGSVELLKNAFTTLFTDLKEVWASPNAVEFSNQYTSEIETFMHDFASHVGMIDDGARAAYNAAANANGAQTIEALVDFEPGGGYALPCALDAEKNGVVGMNIVAVRDAVLTDFKLNMESALASFADIPNAIALYDDADGQRHAYASRIEKFKDAFSDMAEQITSKVLEYANNESDRVELAAEQATEALEA